MRRLRTAERYYRFSQRLARRAAVSARRQQTFAGVAAVIIANQATQAAEAQAATTAMLLEQGLALPAEASLIPLAFTTPQSGVEAMLASIQRELEQQLPGESRELRDEIDARFARLTTSLVQDAGRAAQSVDVATRPRVAFVRHLTLPSCSRCAVLAGRVYRYSEGFQRHPNCDCTMLPTTLAAPDLTYDPEQLARDGLVRGLSKADMKALEDGADFGRVVNVRRSAAGLRDSGEVLARAGRPTPAGIYRRAQSRDEAVALLRRHGYIR